MLNRIAVIIGYTQPFVDWINGADPSPEKNLPSQKPMMNQPFISSRWKIRIEHPGGPTEITLYNRAIMLFHTNEEFYVQVHRVCCALNPR